MTTYNFFQVCESNGKVHWTKKIEVKHVVSDFALIAKYYQRNDGSWSRIIGKGVRGSIKVKSDDKGFFVIVEGKKYRLTEETKVMEA
jgi:hypothetical protein